MSIHLICRHYRTVKNLDHAIIRNRKKKIELRPPVNADRAGEMLTFVIGLVLYGTSLPKWMGIAIYICAVIPFLVSPFPIAYSISGRILNSQPWLIGVKGSASLPKKAAHHNYGASDSQLSQATRWVEGLEIHCDGVSRPTWDQGEDLCIIWEHLLHRKMASQDASFRCTRGRLEQVCPVLRDLQCE